MAYRGLLEMLDMGLQDSRDPVDHHFFMAGVEAFYSAMKHMLEFPCYGWSEMEHIEWDEYAAYLTAIDGFRVPVEVA